MINRKHLLKDLKPLLKRLEDDILERSESAEDVLQHVRSQYDSARAGGRTGLAFSQWRDDYITQSAVAWILACVFVRFVEDNELIDRFFISGAGKTLSRVKDDRLQFFKDNPTLTDRE